MYEALTNYISILDEGEYGEQIIDKHKIAIKLIEQIFEFQEEHPEYELKKYRTILEKNHIDWDFDSMNNVNVSNFDGKKVMALLVATFRADHFCEGAFEEFIQAGCIKRWLMRLKAIDEAESKTDTMKQRKKKVFP